MRAIVSISIFLFLIGCSSYRIGIDYVEPTSGPITKMTIKNDSQREFYVAYYNESRMCKQRRYITDLQPGQNSTHSIPANKEITLMYYQDESSDGQYCIFNLRFTPVTDKKYRLVAFNKGSRCLARMFELSGGSREKEIQLRNIPFKIGDSENGSFCNE